MEGEGITLFINCADTDLIFYKNCLCIMTLFKHILNKGRVMMLIFSLMLACNQSEKDTEPGKPSMSTPMVTAILKTV